jgi:hypothetical protein
MPVNSALVKPPCIEFWRLPKSDVLRHEKRLTGLFVPIPKPPHRAKIIIAEIIGCERATRPKRVLPALTKTGELALILAQGTGVASGWLQRLVR